MTSSGCPSIAVTKEAQLAPTSGAIQAALPVDGSRRTVNPTPSRRSRSTLGGVLSTLCSLSRCHQPGDILTDSGERDRRRRGAGPLPDRPDQAMKNASVQPYVAPCLQNHDYTQCVASNGG